MPDIPNRAKLEAELARRFSKLSVQQRRELLTLLGNPPNYGNVPEAFWQKVMADMNGAFVPFMADVYMEAAERLITDLPIGVDWALVNERAVSWARLHGGELVRGITNNTRRIVQSSTATFYETAGMTMGDLEKLLTPAFGPKRAELIAITEVTRASVQAEIGVAEELADEGILMIARWGTLRDELTCPICGPMHGVEASGYTGKRDPYWNTSAGESKPPAHPRCRCMVSFELPKVIA